MHGRPLAEEELKQIHSMYPLTFAAADALLMEAGMELERGDASAALTVLSQLDMDLLGEEASELAEELQYWAASIREGAGSQGERQSEIESPFPIDPRLPDVSTPVDLKGEATDIDARSAFPPPLDRPLWQAQLPQPPFEERSVLQPRWVNSLAMEDPTPLPTASAKLLLFNTNEQVIALDRLSGRPRWQYTVDNEIEAQTLRGRFQRENRRVIEDQRQVAVAGNRGFAVVGHAVPWNRRRVQSTAPTRLICFDLQSGEPEWQVLTIDLGDEFDDAAFHGTPQVSGDLVLAMIRRSQASSFQDSYLVAIEASSGRLRWRRHLASTAGPANQTAMATLSEMTLAGGRVYFTDNLGVAAAVDAKTGSVAWIRLLFESGLGPLSRVAASMAMPLTSRTYPVVCDAGVIFPLKVDAAFGLLLDPGTGEIKQRFAESSRLAKAREIVAYRGGLVVVGTDVALLDGPSLKREWSFSPSPEFGDGMLQAVVAGTRLFVAEIQGRQFWEIDPQTGDVLASQPIAWAGRFVTLPASLVVVSEGRVGSYLDWGLAVTQMRERARADADDPEPGLNMAMLAVNAEQPDALDEGVELAVAALSRSAAENGRATERWAAARHTVFVELLMIASDSMDVEPEVVERLFDRLALLSDSAPEMLAYHLTRGDYLERQGRSAEAAEHYQQILMDPELADSESILVDQSGRGEIQARRSLETLIAAHGLDLYRPFDEAARRELVALSNDERATADDFLSLVQSYPLSQIVPQATLEAAGRLASGDRHQAAIVQYRRAYHFAQDATTRARAAAGLTAYYQRRHRYSAAIRWLEQVARDDNALSLPRPGGPVTIGQWLGELRAAGERASSVATLQFPLTSQVVLPGGLLPIMDNPGFALEAGVALWVPITQNQQIECYDLRENRRRWRIAAPNPNLQLIHQGEDNVILWSASTRRLHGIDAETGQPLWPACAVEMLLEGIPELSLAEKRRANAGSAIEQIEVDFGPIRLVERDDGAAMAIRDAPPRLIAGEVVVVVAAADGRAAGIDRNTGRVLWQRVLPVDELGEMRVLGTSLAVSGLAAPQTEVSAGRVMLIDLVTGEQRFPVVEDRDAITFLGETHEGDLVVCGREQLRVLSSRDGSVRWRHDVTAFSGTPTVSISGPNLYVMDSNRLASFDASTGRSLSDDAHLLGRDVRPDGQGSLVGALSGRVVAVAADGSLVWSDAAQAFEGKLVAHEVAGPWVVLAMLPEELPRGEIEVFLLERTGGRLRLQMHLSGLKPNPVPNRIAVFENRLMLAGRDWVTVLSAKASP